MRFFRAVARIFDPSQQWRLLILILLIFSVDLIVNGCHTIIEARNLSELLIGFMLIPAGAICLFLSAPILYEAPNLEVNAKAPKEKPVSEKSKNTADTQLA